MLLNRERITLTAGLVAGALLVAACSSASPATTTTSGSVETTSTVSSTTDVAADGDLEVSIEGFAFGPSDITISVGDTVTWVNNDGVGHTATSDEGVWNSELLNGGDTFERTFDEAGTFEYSCSIHPSMTATITVNG